MNGRRKKLRVELIPKDDMDPVEIRYDIASNLWAVPNMPHLEMRVDNGHEYEDLTINKFFNRFYPWFYMPDGGVLKRGFLYRPKTSYDHLPSSCQVLDFDWSDCDIVVEYESESRQAAHGKKSVHDCLQDYLESNAVDDTVIFKDHGSKEAADFVRFDQGSKIIHLYHCKSCPKYSSGPNKGKANIGATIAHVKDIIDQVIRSNIWVKTRNLLRHIKDRNERENQSSFIRGDHLFDNLQQAFVPAEWKYQVFIVNPGLHVEQARTNENTNLILLTCYEWLRGIDTDLCIIGFKEV